MLLAIVSVAMRFWARANSEAKFGVDDALIIPAAVSRSKASISMRPN